MTGSLKWEAQTNTTENSCKTLQCSCGTFWELYQQEAIKRLSHMVNVKTNSYRLEIGYEARARRIASVYAKMYLEQEINGNPQLMGRYYWMGLGAFASKTVASVFKHGLTRVGYALAPVDKVRTPVHVFAKGNLWLYMDIAPWHYAWSASSASFQQCLQQRNVATFQHIKQTVLNLPWSDCLSTLNQLKSTKEIESAFARLPKMESILSRKNYTRDKNFKAVADDLLKHLMDVAVQEQRNILQKIVWEDENVQFQASVQRISHIPDSTLVLAHDYDACAVKKNVLGEYSGEHAKELAELPETVYQEPLSDTIVENYDSRMAWIDKAANKYHRLMLGEKGRQFLEKELAIIATWGNSTASFTVKEDSNDGKI